MTPQEAQQIPQGQRFQHYKGGIYTFLFVGRHSETEEWFVVYENVKKDIWIRPLDMFFETVEKAGQKVQRFAPLDNH